jgi:micrococcal nuclease
VRRLLLPLLSLLLMLPAAALAGDDDRDPSYDGWVRLGGSRVAVHWADGDSFEFQTGARKGKETRLIGFNTLESYGPVHRWGEWTGQELWGLAKKAGRVAAKREWECTASGKRDAYNRLLVDCPELRRHLLRRGLAHLFAYDDPADPAEIELQTRARIDQVGMWSKGRPEVIVTAVHSAGGGSSGRMRIVHTRTGETEMVGHRSELAICDELCSGDKWTGSCMLYVPYPLRYDPAKKPECIQGEPPEL